MGRHYSVCCGIVDQKSEYYDCNAIMTVI